MKREDFFNVYGVIEAQAKVMLQEQMAKSSSTRKLLFSDAFDGDGRDQDSQQRARKKYLDQVYEDLESMATPMSDMTTNVLNIAKLS